MSAILIETPEPLLSQKSEDSEASNLPVEKVIERLVGHTIEEIERELILYTLTNYHGNRTLSAKVLGISIRSMRNKIRKYENIGIAVPPPEPAISVRHWHIGGDSTQDNANG